MELRRKYETKKSELELKRAERARISQDFEAKIKTKEVRFIQVAYTYGDNVTLQPLAR